jgi:amino acid permease
MSTAPRIQMRPLTWLLIAVALVFVLLAIVYFVTPANQLPSVFPGHTAHATRHHTKHGLAALGVAVVALIGAWFTTAPARATT